MQIVFLCTLVKVNDHGTPEWQSTNTEREGGGGGGVLRLGNDGDDRRIFWGLKFSIPGIFWVAKFGKYFFG